MLRDIISLLRVEWKRVKSEADYWLKVLGFDPESLWTYRVYVFLFWLYWLVVVWGFGVDQVYRISLSLSSETVAALLQFVPNGVLWVQILYFAALLRESPLKLNAPELTYVATAPVQRGAVVVVQFLRRMLLPAVFFGLAGALLSMLLSWQSFAARVGFIGLQASFLTVLLVYISAAVGWALALLKLRPLSRWQRWLFWLALPLLALFARLIPEVGFWGGRLWQAALPSPLASGDWIGIALVFAAALLVVLLLGQRVYMPLVSDGSQLYARIERLGWLGKIYARDVISRIHRQTRLARKKQLKLAMPVNAAGYRALWSRMVLRSLRFFPGSFLRPLLSGITLALVLTSTASIGGWQTPQVWLLVLMLLLYNRPIELAAPFRDTMSAAFVQQFLPGNPLAAFAISAAHPLLIASAGSLLVLLLLGWSHPFVLLLMLLSLMALAFAQALEVVDVPLGFTRRLPYVYTVIIYVGLVFVAGVLLQSLWLALIVAVFANVGMALLLRNST